jgi:hypothetical protein
MNAESYSLGFADKLKLDQDILNSMSSLQAELNYNRIISGARRMDLGLLQNMEQTKWNYLGPDRPIEKNIAPRTNDLEFPREGTVGDIYSAVISLPQVKVMIEELENDAFRIAKEFWESKTTSQKTIMIASTAVVSLAALGAIVSNDPAREMTLRFINGKNIPVPGIPEMSIMLKPIGEDKSVMISIDVGSLLQKYAPKSSITQIFH